MSEGSFLTKLSDQLIQERNLRLAPILVNYDSSLQAEITSEEDELRLWARHLDRLWEAFASRCQAAKRHTALAGEMQKLRMHALQFNLYLRSAKQLLKLEHRRLVKRTELSGLDGAAAKLLITWNLSKVTAAVEVSDVLQGKAIEQLPRNEEIRLFAKSLLLPVESRRQTVVWSAVSRGFANAMLKFTGASTRRIYREQIFSLLVIIWRVIRPTMIALTIGLLVAYLLDIAKEVLGVHVLHPEIWAVLAFASSFLFEKAVEGLFEEWHLERYRKVCLRTALTLYASELRARAALIGLIALAEAEPAAPPTN